MASFNMDVRADVREVERMLTDVQKKIVPKAATAALNRTIKQVQTQSVKEVSAITKLKAKDIRENMKQYKASWNRLQASIHAQPYAPNLINFKAKEKAKPKRKRKNWQGGVYASAWGKRKLYRGAFIANKGRTVFTREIKGGQKVGRLPIKALKGPSLPRTFVQPKVNKAMHQVADRVWRQRFKHELDRRLKKYA